MPRYTMIHRLATRSGVVGSRRPQFSCKFFLNSVAESTSSRYGLIGASASRLGNARCFSYPPHEVVGLPALSPTMESGQLGKWNKHPGDEFAAGDIFCEVQTDKATVDFEAQDDGFVAKHLVEAGAADIKVGDPIMVICESAEDVDAFKDFVLEDSSSPPDTGASATPTPEPEAAPVPAPTPQDTIENATPQPSNSAGGGSTKASPLAYKLAKEAGHDISIIDGTGPGGRVLADDVREYVPPVAATAAAEASAGAGPAVPSTAPAVQMPPVYGSGFTDYPLSADAQMVAQRLMQSKRNVPHYYLTVDLNLEQLLALRSSLNATLRNPKLGDEEQTVISVNDMMAKASACAMKVVPEVNGAWMQSFVRVYDNVDLNIIAGSGDGLVTPVIRAVNLTGLAQISQSIKSATQAATDGTLEAEQCATGTFSMINLGMYGIKSAAPIIMEPQACMLALGAAENRIVPNTDPDSDQIYKRAVMLTATLSCDHRVVDGAVGAQWLSAFKQHVENPTTLLL